MDVVTTPGAGAPRLPWRRLSVLALLTILLAGALAFYVGSQRQELPAPFGPARNGLIALARDGDIVTVDPISGDVHQIVTGPEMDVSPVFSGDGTRLAFRRQVTGELGRLLVANSDGTGLVPVIADPTHLFGWTFSHDNRALLVIAVVDGIPQVLLVGSDGESTPRVLDVPLPTDPDWIEFAGFRPSDPTEILVVADSQTRANRGLVVVDTDTDEMRTIVPPDPVADVYGASWSPDGAWITYGRFVPANTVTARSHIIAADGTGGRRLDASPGTDFDGLKGWSNDSTRFVIERGFNDNDPRHVILTLDGTSAPIEIDCGGGGTARCPDGWRWSPDDTMLLGFRNEEGAGMDRYLMADPLTGAVSEAAFSASGDPSWQRLAP